METWESVDAYLGELLVGKDHVLESALAESEAAGLPQIAVSPPLGKFLQLLARMQGARRILEIGTLGGYSTIWLARALPAEGTLVTLEFEPHHAEVARRNLERAGLAERVVVLTGPGLESLPKLTGPFDFIFIDANKDGYPEYFTWALKLSRPGTVIIADNVVREGAVTDPHHPDERVQGVRRFLAMAAAEPRVTATVLQTVGSKGYDGFAFVLVTG